MKYKEMSFPVNYRQAEVKRILGALGRLRSIAVTGMAGMGKSNVIRFIASHPQVRERYLGACAADWVFVHVDCAGLAASTEDEILNEIALQLLDQRISRGVVPTDSAVRPPFGLSLTDPAGSTGSVTMSQ